MKTKKKINPQVAKSNAQNKTVNSRMTLMAGLVVSALAFLLYSNTLNHEYALDDFPTIYGNRLTMLGFDGIPTMLHTAYWYGLDGKNDWLYRPLSMVMFAAEWELSNGKPWLGHLINVLLYALTSFLLFRFLSELLSKFNPLIPFTVTLLWVAHPIHTEVVANIKSRDEILAMLFSILAMHQTLKYVTKQKVIHLVLTAIYYFLALMAKESPIMLLFIIPMTLYFFTSGSTKNILTSMVPVACSAAVYLIIRSLVLTSQTGDDNIPWIDNTMAAAPDFMHRQAMAFYVLAMYLKLLVFPHPMASDYSYKQIPIVGFENIFAIFGIIAHLALGIYAMLRITKKDPVAYGILFYLAGIALVSNVVFLTRSTAADRFLYFPSLGFTLILVLLIFKALKINIKHDDSLTGFSHLLSYNKTFTLIAGVLLLAGSFKTLARNPDWKNDTTIFSTDIKHSPNSARIHFLHANHLLQDIKQDKTVQENIEANFNEALEHFKIAITLLPTYNEAYMGLGEAYTYKNNFPEAIRWYTKVLEISPNFSNAYNNLGNMYFKMQNFDEGIKYLKKAVQLEPEYADALNNLGSCYFSKGDYKTGIEYFNKAIEINPQFVDAYKNLGSSYGMLQQYDQAITYFLKGIEFAPDDADLYQFVGMTYQFKGDKANTDFYLNKAKELRSSKSK